MDWTRVLEIHPGVTAVIGGGGKTALLRTLGEELSETGGSVLLCTTTRIFPFDDLPCITEAEEDALLAAREKSGLICTGTLLENGKLTVPAVPMARLAALFDYVLVEADGSAHRPMKAHAPHEPVIRWRLCRQSAWWVRLALDAPFKRRRIDRSAMRSWLERRRRRCHPRDRAALQAKKPHRRVRDINRFELAAEEAKKLAELLDCPAVAGSLLLGEIF